MFARSSRLAENGDLIFFSAIDEGMVLSLADAENMVDHLEREMDELSREMMPRYNISL